MIALGRKYIAYFIAILNYEIDMKIIGNRGRSLKKSAYSSQFVLAFTSSSTHPKEAFNERLGVNNVFSSDT